MTGGRGTSITRDRGCGPARSGTRERCGASPAASTGCRACATAPTSPYEGMHAVRGSFRTPSFPLIYLTFRCLQAPPPPPKAPPAMKSSPKLAPATTAPAGQSALLAAIANPENNKMLKHVSIQVKDTKTTDPNSMLNVRAAAAAFHSSHSIDPILNRFSRVHSSSGEPI